MDFASHWKFEDFYPDAHLMRQKIDEHFTDSIARKEPFDKRAIWNYWFIPTLYMYLRAEPWVLFPTSLFDQFMAHLRAFAARQFGLIIDSQPFVSMYVNGCGQNIHNDFGNGRLAYVFSLTKWAERHFLGGETFIYKTGHQATEKVFQATGGWGWYDFVEPVFNRLALFDDRLPHAVNPVQGTMDPLDARFVLHGHMEEAETIPYIEGGLRDADLRMQFDQAKNAISKMFRSHALDGFLSLELLVGESGASGQVDLRCMQLLSSSQQSKSTALATDDTKEILSKIIWPASVSPSKMVFAIGSSPLR
jgi:hypothetical protein